MENRDMSKVNPFVKQAAIKSAVGNSLFGGTRGGYYGGKVGENSDLGFSRWGAAFAFRQISPVYRSATLLASAVNSVPWRIVDQKTDKTVDHSEEYQPSHPVAKVIKDFRKTHDHGLFYFWESSRALYGVNYLEKQRNIHRFPAGLKWLNPLYVTNRVMYDKLIGFDYSRERYQNFTAIEVSYDRIPDDSSYTFDGISPTMAAMAKINVDRNVLRTWGAYFRNGAQPSAVVAPKGEDAIFTPEETATLKQFFKNVKGVDDQGKTIIAPLSFEMDTFGQPDLSKQIALPVQMEDDIYATYGVDRSVAGDTSALRYKAGNEVFGWFKSGILASECLAIQDEVNASIIPFFAERPDLAADPERFRFEFEIGVFDETLQDAPAKQQSVLSNLGAGLITVNEARVEQGLDEIAGGDVLQWPSSATPVKLGGLDALTAPTPEGDGGGSAFDIEPAIAPDEETADDTISGKEATVSIDTPLADVEVDKDLVLNGAQITSALSIVDAVAAGQLPRESGINMLTGFFSMTDAQAENIMGEVGRGFVSSDVEVAKAKIKSLAIRAVLLSQESVNYTTQASGNERCEGCRWFIFHGPRKDINLDPEHACQIIEGNKPAPIVPEGNCDRWEQTSPAPESTKADDDAAIFVAVPMQYTPAIKDVQDQLRAHIGEDGIDYQAPATLHITMVYCGESVEDEALEELLEEMETPAAPIGIRSSSLIELGHTGSRAICMEVEKTNDLADWQAKLYAAFSNRGLELSPFSEPENWIPHITLAYVPDSIETPNLDFEVEVDTDGLSVSNGDYEEVARWEDSARKVAAYNSEMKAWQKFADNRNHLKRDFTPKALRGDLGDFINAGLSEAGKDKVAVKAVFEKAEEMLTFRRIDATMKSFIENVAMLVNVDEDDAAIKALADTQKSFMDGFNNQLKMAVAGDTTRGRWSARTRAIIAGWGRQAYIDGLNDGGVIADEGRRPDSVLSDGDKIGIKRLSKNSSSFVSNLGKEIFRGEGISDAQAAQKAQQWWNGSVLPYYNAGVLSANKNQMMEFTGSDGEESCVTCRKLKGQRHRQKHIESKGFYKENGNKKFICECYECLHNWVPVKGRARGNWLKDAPGKWS